MAYIEKKKINGNIYYYLTKTKRVNGKFKKKRKYLGTKIPKDIEKYLKKKKTKIKIKHYLTKRQLKIVDKIKKEYSKKYKIDKTLWKTEKQKLISFIYNTNAIEGNTLSLKDTEEVLKGKKIKGLETKKRDVKEIKNMKQCILKLHKIEMNGLMQDAGKFRIYDVKVGNYFCPKYQELPKLMFELIGWYNINKNKLHIIELASLMHLKFVKIHPFGDGNGRVARLLMNFIMLNAEYPLINIFNDEKMYYYLVLQKYDSDNKEKDFVKYIYELFGIQYKEYVK